MQNGPGSSAPGSYPSGVPNVGPDQALQSKETWLPGQTDERPILSATKNGLMPWRVTVLGKNIEIRISYGTSSNFTISGLRPPVRVTLPGSCDVYAKPLVHEGVLAAEAGVSAIQVTSGCCDSECRKKISGAQVIEDQAVRFVALEDSVVRVGPFDDFISVSLTTLQEVSLIAGSALTSGGGFLEFEP